MVNLEGLFPPIPTPFTVDEEIDFDSLRSNVEKWSKYDFAGRFLITIGLTSVK